MLEDYTFEKVTKKTFSKLLETPSLCYSFLKTAETSRLGTSSFHQAKIFLHGTHNVNYFRDYLRLIGLWDRIDFDISVGPIDFYNTQILSDPNFAFDASADFYFLCDSWRSLANRIADDQDPHSFLSELITIVERIREESNALIFLTNFDYPNPSVHYTDYGSKHTLTQFVRTVNSLIDEQFTNLEGVVILDINYLSSQNRVYQWTDNRLWYTSKQHWSPAANVVIGNELTKLISPLVHHRYIKVLVCDLDNSLWGGIAADDGIDHIRISAGDPVGESYIDFQNTIKKIMKAGTVLAICSKNEPTIVNEVFRVHTEMPLRLDDFSSSKINWRRKSENIIDIAEELNVGLESIAFIDDNPREVAEVCGRLSEVTAIHLSGDPANFSEQLIASLPLRLDRRTKEDLHRSKMYNSFRSREHARSLSFSENDFLQSLNILASPSALRTEDVPRVVQLINKTNQFNLSLSRTTTDAINQLMGDPTHYIFTCKASDKYGHNGLISAMVLQSANEELNLLQWVLSCRVFGLKFEYYFFDWAISQLKNKHNTIHTCFVQGKLNSDIKCLLKNLGFKQDKSDVASINFSARIEALSIDATSHITTEEFEIE